MRVDEIVTKLNQVEYLPTRVGWFPSPHDLFVLINSDEKLYTDSSVHDAIVRLMTKKKQSSVCGLDKALNLLGNSKFIERLASEMESTKLSLMADSSSIGDKYSLLQTAFIIRSLHANHRFQEALVVLIHNLPEKIWGGEMPKNLIHALVSIIRSEPLRNNPEIVKAIARNFTEWNNTGGLFQELLEDITRISPASEVFLSHPAFIEACKRVIRDRENFSMWTLPGRVFNDTVFVPVLAEKLITMDNPISLIEVVWQYKQLKEHPTIQETILKCKDTVAGIIRKNRAPYFLMKHIQDVSILLDEKNVQEAIISRAEDFIKRILKEGLPENLEFGDLGDAQEKLYRLPFLRASEEFVTEYNENIRFKEIMDILFPKFKWTKNLSKLEEKIDLSSDYFWHIDLAPLSSCTNLRELRLDKGNIENIDLNPLSSCTVLELLSIESNALMSIDLAPLSSCTNLRQINLGYNRLETIDLTPLSSCINLESLTLFKNQLKTIDLTPLSSCTGLYAIRLDDNLLTTIDLAPLKPCVNLQKVDLTKNKISSLDITAPHSGVKVRN